MSQNIPHVYYHATQRLNRRALLRYFNRSRLDRRIYPFTRRYYNDFIIENLAWCQQNANLNIYTYVIMTNHIHLVANVTDGSLGDVLGRFKSYTSKELYKMIAGNTQESRRDWMLKAFDRAGKHNPLNEKHQLWQNGNYPVVLYTPAVIEQKIDYTHENPVRAGFVGSAHEYWV
ncbi:MAG: Transposase like protein [Mucilaginibacter sp.]|nr:Transposase like protein [Mucilaginibacter sp.]